METEPRQPLQFGLKRLFTATSAMAAVTWAIAYHPYFALGIAVLLLLLFLQLAAWAGVFFLLRFAVGIFTDDKDVRWPTEDP